MVLHNASSVQFLSLDKLVHLITFVVHSCVKAVAYLPAETFGQF